jgi:hypothetical protein
MGGAPNGSVAPANVSWASFGLLKAIAGDIDEPASPAGGRVRGAAACHGDYGLAAATMVSGWGADTDSERAIRWLIALMVLTCDPLAIALTAAASARRSSV